MNVDDLLASERNREGFSHEQREAMWQAVATSVGHGAVANSMASGASRVSSAASIASTGGRIATRKLAGLLSIAAVGGAVIGAVVHARFGEPRVVQVEVTKIVSAEPTVIANPLVNAPPAVPHDVPPSTTAAPSATPASATTAPLRLPRRSEESTPPIASTPVAIPKDPALARDRLLLDMARTALSRGDTQGAFTSLDAHAHEFPSSQLTEEREVLAIQALISANRTAEARLRADRFRARFPTSPLRSVVDEATQ